MKPVSIPSPPRTGDVFVQIHHLFGGRDGYADDTDKADERGLKKLRYTI